MNETNQTPEDTAAAKTPDPISEEERAEMQRLDALIYAGRGRTVRTGSLKDLRAIMYLAVGLLMVAIGAYLALQAPDRRTVALMACITGGVLSVWGAMKGAAVAQGGGIASIGWIYTLFFGGLALIFGVMSAGLIGWLDGK